MSDDPPLRVVDRAQRGWLRTMRDGQDAAGAYLYLSSQSKDFDPGFDQYRD